MRRLGSVPEAHKCADDDGAGFAQGMENLEKYGILKYFFQTWKSMEFHQYVWKCMEFCFG